MAKVLGAAAVTGAATFGGGKAVKQLFPSKPEAPIAKVNHGAKPVTKPSALLTVQIGRAHV